MMITDMITISKIKEHPSNPRTHTIEQIQKIAKSIQGNGWGRPIILSKDDYVLAGHGALEAAKSLGMKEVPYRYLTPLRDHNEPEAIAYMIADNKTTDDSYWNHSKLDTLFEDLKLTGFDVELTGFDINDEPINIENPDFDIEKEWEGMPELKQEITNIRLVVHFRNEDDKTEFGELISQKLDETTKSIWHPPLEHQSSMDHIYTDIE